MLMRQCYTVKSGIDAELSAGTLGENQTYADAWLSGVSPLETLALNMA
jgi:hypothetical protein